MKKITVRLALNSFTSIKYFEDLNIFELADVAEDIEAVINSGK